MKTIKLSIFAFALLICSTTTFAQTADEIINKYIKNIGGAEKLKALKGIKMDIITNYGGMELPVEMVQLAGGKQLPG